MSDTSPDFKQLTSDIRQWARALGFQQTGISDTDLSHDEASLFDWLQQGYHGEMDYMQRHGTKRSRPAELLSGTVRIISVRMDYQPAPCTDENTVLADPQLGYVSRYALGRDYHKLMRQRLQKLADQINAAVGDMHYRVFVDSAPVLERAIAQKAGLGWIGKHTNLINKSEGSWFFLGEIYTDLPLPVDAPTEDHCGTCQSCIDICPTQAIVAPYTLDARRCISYLTIELRGAIPVALRSLMGNRIYGCDDCQLVCPWNRFASPTGEDDFLPRAGLDAPQLLDLFSWSEDEFLRKTEGSAIRRIGHESWLRNIAVALGNAPTSAEIIQALKDRLDHPSNMVREHIEWAIKKQSSTIFS